MELAGLVLALADAAPEVGVLVRLGDLGGHEHPVVLADDLVAVVPDRGQEVVVDREDLAVQVELDDGLRAVHRGGLARVVGAHLLGRGHVDRVLHDLPGLSVDPDDRVVDGLEPDVTTALADPVELAGHELALAQALPELTIGGGTGLLGGHEHAVVLADDLLPRVAHGLAEVVVRVEDHPTEVELDDGLGTVDGLDLSLASAVARRPPVMSSAYSTTFTTRPSPFFTGTKVERIHRRACPARPGGTRR